MMYAFSTQRIYWENTWMILNTFGEKFIAQSLHIWFIYFAKTESAYDQLIYWLEHNEYLWAFYKLLVFSVAVNSFNSVLITIFWFMLSLFRPDFLFKKKKKTFCNWKSGLIFTDSSISSLSSRLNALQVSIRNQSFFDSPVDCSWKRE